MNKEPLAVAADWLCRCFSMAHPEMSPCERREIYDACTHGESALMAALRRVMGKELPDIFLDASQELCEVCEVGKLGFAFPPTENGIVLERMFIDDLQHGAEALLSLVERYFPGIDETCRQNLVSAKEANLQALTICQNAMDEIKKDQDSFP